ncbi:MAG TPA: ABC transporter permease [Kofleriaceae bacterium]|jgi:putative ABC transport system permease protein|nr:ABC transporter permease [Kofleriaceae bacterium]
MVPVRYNLRSLLVRKVTTGATAVGIALVVFVFAAALMLGEGIDRALATAGRPDNVIILRKGSDSELASAIGNDYVNLFGAQPQVSQAGGVIGEIIIVVTAERSDDSGVSNVLVRGTPPTGIAFRPEIKIVRGRMPKPGTNEAIVGKAIAGRFKGITIDDSFDLRHNRPLQIVGEFSADGSSYESEVWGDLDTVRRALGRDAVVSSARVRLNSPSDFDAYRGLIEGDKSVSMKVQREADYYDKQSQATSGFLKGMGIGIAVLFSLAAMLGAAITMNGAIAHRSREIGTLRALGFSRFSILLSFLFEAIVLSVIGGVIGSAFVLLLSFVTFPVMNFQTFSEIVISFHATPAVFVKALVFSGVMGLLGGLVPAIRASRVSPIEAMRA